MFGPERSMPSELPIGYPPPTIAPRRIQGDWTVWAFSDTRGAAAGLLGSLVRAGLADVEGHWVAPPRTALVGVGGYLDGNSDGAGVLRLLRRLRDEADERIGTVRLVRGHREQWLADILRGEYRSLAPWLLTGGRSFIRSIGHVPRPIGSSIGPWMEAKLPGALDWLLGTLPYVVWRDVLFVHAAPVQGGSLDALEQTDRQLHEVGRFYVYRRGIRDAHYAGYRSDGIGRVVAGLIPQFGMPIPFHFATSMILDSNARGRRGHKRLPMPSAATLVRIPPDGSLGSTEIARVLLNKPGRAG
jgi:hypothetical protein